MGGVEGYFSCEVRIKRNLLNIILCFYTSLIDNLFYSF